MHVECIASALPTALSHQHWEKRQTCFSPSLGKGKSVKTVHGVLSMNAATAGLGKEAQAERAQPYCVTKSC